MRINIGAILTALLRLIRRQRFITVAPSEYLIVLHTHVWKSEDEIQHDMESWRHGSIDPNAVSESLYYLLGEDLIETTYDCPPGTQVIRRARLTELGRERKKELFRPRKPDITIVIKSPWKRRAKS